MGIGHRVTIRENGYGKRTFSDRQRQRRGNASLELLREEVSPDIRRPFVGAEDNAKDEALATTASTSSLQAKTAKITKPRATKSKALDAAVGTSRKVFQNKSISSSSSRSSGDVEKRGAGLLSRSRRRRVADELEQQRCEENVDRIAKILQTDALLDSVRGLVRKSRRVLQKLACGAVAGAVSRTLTAPVETVKTVMMVSGEKLGPVSTGVMILERDGWRGLFRGNTVNVLRVAPSKAIELFAFDSMRRLLTDEETGESRLVMNGVVLPMPPASVAGACAGLSSTVVTYPMEVLKTRLTIEAGKYNGIGDCFVRLIRYEGVRSLYRGLVASALGIIPYAATNYYTYDFLRRQYKTFKRRRLDSMYAKNNKMRKRSSSASSSSSSSSHDKYYMTVGTLPTLIIGSTSGAIAASVTFPLEVVRRQLQAGALSGTKVAYSSMGECAMGIMKEHGIRGFYRGLGPSCIKLMPAAGISFATYELMKTILLIDYSTTNKKEAKDGKTNRKIKKKEKRRRGSRIKDPRNGRKMTL